MDVQCGGSGGGVFVNIGVRPKFITHHCSVQFVTPFSIHSPLRFFQSILYPIYLVVRSYIHHIFDMRRSNITIGYMKSELLEQRCPLDESHLCHLKIRT